MPGTKPQVILMWCCVTKHGGVMPDTVRPAREQAIQAAGAGYCYAIRCAVEIGKEVLNPQNIMLLKRTDGSDTSRLRVTYPNKDQK